MEQALGAPAATDLTGAGEKSPLREMFTVAGPAIVTMLSPAVMHFVDGRLVAELGPTAVAAQGNGSMLAFSIMAFFMGLTSVVSTFASQNFGAKRPRQCGRYGWTAVWLSLLCAVGVLPLALFVEPAFRAMGHAAIDPDLLRLETRYAVILLTLGFFPAIGARGLSQFFYGVHRARTVMLATIAGNLVNIAASYTLIFGAFGMPQWGVAGAAVGTAMGHSVELAIMLAVFLSRSFDGPFNTRASWRPDRRAIRDVLRLGWPAALHWGNEVACWGLFMAWVVGRFGPQDAAAGYIALQWMRLGFLPVVGLSQGVSAVVGAQAGARRLDLALARGMLGLKIGMLYMVAMGVFMILFREPMALFFLPESAGSDPATRDEVLRIASRVIVLGAFFQAFDAMGIVLGGALRGVGDTTWPGVFVVATAWTLLIGGGWLAGELAPQWRSVGPWVAAALFLIVSGVGLLWRFRAGPWREIDLLGGAGGSQSEEQGRDGDAGAA